MLPSGQVMRPDVMIGLGTRLGTTAVMAGMIPGITDAGAGTILGIMAMAGIPHGILPGIHLITMAGMIPGITVTAGMAPIITAGTVAVASDIIMRIPLVPVRSVVTGPPIAVIAGQVLRQDIQTAIVRVNCVTGPSMATAAMAE